MPGVEVLFHAAADFRVCLGGREELELPLPGVEAGSRERIGEAERNELNRFVAAVEVRQVAAIVPALGLERGRHGRILFPGRCLAGDEEGGRDARAPIEPQAAGDHRLEPV